MATTDFTPPPGGPAWHPSYPTPPPPYPPYEAYAQPVQLASTNGLAVASLVLAIVWVWGVGSILALVLGYLARNQIRRTGQRGNGVATAGIMLGWVGVSVFALGMIVAL